MKREEAIIEVESYLYLGETSIVTEEFSLILEAINQGLEVYGEKDFMSYGRGSGSGSSNSGTGFGVGGGIGEGYGFENGFGNGFGY